MSSKNYGCYLANTGTLNDDGLTIYKIGKSYNITERIKSHRTSTPMISLVKAFTFDHNNLDQNKKSLELSAMEKHIHAYLQDYAFDTQGRGREFFCFDNDDIAVDKINEAIECTKTDLKLIHTQKDVNMLADKLRKAKRKRKSNQSFLDIDLTIRRSSHEERSQVHKELSDWHCIEKRLLEPTEEESIKDDYEEKYKVVDEKGRLCWNRAGLPIPRHLRDDHMLAHYKDTVIWFSENQPEIVHEDLNENYKNYQDIRKRNLANVGLS